MPLCLGSKGERSDGSVLDGTAGYIRGVVSSRSVCPALGFPSCRGNTIPSRVVGRRAAFVRSWLRRALEVGGSGAGLAGRGVGFLAVGLCYLASLPQAILFYFCDIAFSLPTPHQPPPPPFSASSDRIGCGFSLPACVSLSPPLRKVHCHGGQRSVHHGAELHRRRRNVHRRMMEAAT